MAKFKVTNPQGESKQFENLSDEQIRKYNENGYSVKKIEPTAATKPAPVIPLAMGGGQPKTDTSPNADAPKMPLEFGLLSAPAVIREGLKRNPKRILATAALNTAVPNAYQASKEGRNIMPGLGIDIAQWLISPFKSLALLGKLQPIKKIGNMPLIKPIDKSLSMKTNISRNIGREAATGAIDNLIYEGLADLQDNRERNLTSYGIAGGLGGLTGGASGLIQVRNQAKAADDYKKFLTPASFKGQTKQNIRNAQNDTDSNLETYSKMVNREHPFTTTAALHKKKEQEAKNIGLKINEYGKMPEANKPVENAKLSDFQNILAENLYNDNSGNLSRTEKNLVMENFQDDALDMLISNSPSLKKYMEENSKKVLGNARAYLGNEEFIDLAMKHYSLTPNDINLLRKSFQDKTTLVIPSKAGYVRAGEDNRGNNEYYRLFKGEIEKQPETNEIDKLNKEFSKAKNQKELAEEVMRSQKIGGIMGKHFPFFDLNPEINPTIKGNDALKARNLANVLIAGKKNYSEIPEENREDYHKILSAMVQDAQNLGIKTEEGIQKYVISRLEGGNIPSHEVIGYSTQKRGEK